MNERKKPRWEGAAVAVSGRRAGGGRQRVSDGSCRAGLWRGGRPWPCWERRCWPGPWRPPREGDDKMLLAQRHGARPERRRSTAP